jgi:CDP-paratose synthetase
MEILITGATGFVGRHLIPVLLQNKNNRLILVVRNVEKAQSLFGNKQIDYISASNLYDLQQYSPTHVIHLAAYLTSKDDDESMEKLMDANILFGTKLLNILKDISSIQLFINFGTFAEYKLGPMEINNAYLYSATKTAFKTILSFYAALSNYKYIHIIPYSIYGGIDSQKKVIDYIKDSLDSPEPIKMSGGEQILDFIHINDVVSFIEFTLLHTDKFIGNPTTEYHLGTGKGTSIRELSQKIEKIYNKKSNIQWGGIPYRKRDIMYAVAPIAKLFEMGWRPVITLEKGLKL